MLRVVAGSLKNKQIPIIKDAEFRPSTSKTRQAIFSILGNLNLEALNILDLFCGSGSLGIEALSRDAKFVSFVDINISQLNLLRSFLAKEDLTANAEIIPQDATNSIQSSRLYDLVFMDAPYYQDLNLAALNNLHQSKILSESAILVVETAYNETLDLPLMYLKIDERRYSKNKITFLKYEQK